MDEDVDDLLDRLNVTMRGLDVHPQRPNAVALLLGEAAGMDGELASALAETLFGSGERVVEVDFGPFDSPEDVNALLGPPPGFVGYEGRRPLHEVAQMPWCVLHCRNVDGCHEEVAETLAQALEDGVVTERSGNRVYLSDTVVLLTAPGAPDAGHPLGFHASGEGDPEAESEADGRALAERALGSHLADQVDLVCTEVPTAGAGQRNWVERNLLADLAERYRHRGVRLEWDESFIDWVLEQRKEHPGRTRLVRLVEEQLGEALIPHLPEPSAGEQSVLVAATSEVITACVSPQKKGGGSARRSHSTRTDKDQESAS
jgi:ATP-dependent Clp protease ATP-binding subunit ClpC